jgi:hypothetical protein
VFETAKGERTVVEIAKLVLGYLNALIAWPIVAVFSIWLYRKEVRVLLTRLAEVIDKIKTAGFPGFTVELFDQMAKQAKPSGSRGEQGSELKLELSVSTGGYSDDYRAIVVVAGIANRTDRPEQVVKWELRFPSEDLKLEPTAPPPNTYTPISWWSSPIVDVPANKLIQGTLFFRGQGAFQAGLPHEPLHACLIATTLNEELKRDTMIYKLSTLRQNPHLDQWMS